MRILWKKLFQEEEYLKVQDEKCLKKTVDKRVGRNYLKKPLQQIKAKQTG